MSDQIRKFEIGKYEKSSICDSGCIFKYEITRRNDKSVWISTEGYKAQRKKIHVYDGEEYIYPDGQGSMCTVLRPDNNVFCEEKPEITDKDVMNLAKNTVQAMVDEGQHVLKRFIETDDEDRKEMMMKYVEIAINRFKKFAEEIQNNPEAKRVFCLTVYNMLRTNK